LKGNAACGLRVASLCLASSSVAKAALGVELCGLDGHQHLPNLFVFPAPREERCWAVKHIRPPKTGKNFYTAVPSGTANSSAGSSGLVI
jgi:hypothetical protein